MSTVQARGRADAVDLDVLDAVQRRVLWLATAIVHQPTACAPCSSPPAGTPRR